MANATSEAAFDLKDPLLELVFGPMILGMFCELWLFGIIFAQVCVYRLRYPRDPIHLKLLVAILTGGQFMKMCLCIKAVYSDFTFGQFKEMFEPVPWFILVLPIVGQFPILASQAYLCFRVWVVSDRKVIPTAIGAIAAMLQLSLNLIYVIRRIIDRRFGPESGSQVSRMMPPWAFSNAAADVYLSFTLAYYLLQTRKQSLSHRLDYILVRLASLAITTCLPPACISVAIALLEILEKRVWVWVFFGQILGSVYALCILHALNSREALVQKATLCASGRSSRLTSSRLPATLSVRCHDPEASIGRRSESNFGLSPGGGGRLKRDLVAADREKQVEADADEPSFAFVTTKRAPLECSRRE